MECSWATYDDITRIMEDKKVYANFVQNENYPVYDKDYFDQTVHNEMVEERFIMIETLGDLEVPITESQQEALRKIANQQYTNGLKLIQEMKDVLKDEKTKKKKKVPGKRRKS